MSQRYLMPAEWEAHRATWIAWPHSETDFPGKLHVVQWVYPEIVRLISQSEKVEIIVMPGTADEVGDALQKNGVAKEHYRLHEKVTDRSWARDCLPTLVKHGSERSLVHWKFNAWAKYENFLADEQLPQFVSDITKIALIDPLRPDTKKTAVLEGGGIETDGAGTLLVTEEWLLSDTQIRNPGMTREGYEMLFKEYLGITKTIWLSRGCVGDDTHGHIDDVARFSSKGVVLLAYEEDVNEENHKSSEENFKILSTARDANGNSLKVIKLPYPRPIVFDGLRLPASYANFYITNGAVLVPTFNDERDREALTIIASAFPGRKVIGIHAGDLVWGLGTLHCLTQQEPL